MPTPLCGNSSAPDRKYVNSHTEIE